MFIIWQYKYKPVLMNWNYITQGQQGSACGCVMQWAFQTDLSSGVEGDSARPAVDEERDRFANNSTDLYLTQTLSVRQCPVAPQV